MSSENKITKKGPESFLHRRNEIREKAAKMRFEKFSKKVSKFRKDNKLHFKRAERFLSEGARRDNDAVRLLRVKNSTVTAAPVAAAAPTLILAVRTHDKKGLTVESENVLSNELRLCAPGDAVLLKRNSDVRSALQKVKPFVIFGVPSQSLVSDLVAKKTVIKDPENGELNIEIVDNAMVEKYFEEKFGFVCLEDISHELFSMGKMFEDVSKKMEPFKVQLDKATKKMSGNIKDEINTIVSKLI